MIGLVFVLIPITLYLLYKWASMNHDYFEKQGIAFQKPYLLIGSEFFIFFKKQTLGLSMIKNYNKYRNERVYGGFVFRTPVIYLRCPKIVKKLAVRDFDSFSDHQSYYDNEIDTITGKLVTQLKGQEWRDMRATLSPAFTGSKMRQMFGFVRKVGQQTAASMRDEISKGSENDFEFSALATKFTIDVIATCAFGIEVNSVKDPNNEFYKNALTVANVDSYNQVLKFFGHSHSPKIMSYMGIAMIDPITNELIKAATVETMKIREQRGIVRHDMVNFLMDAKKGQLKHNEAEESSFDGFASVEESKIGKSDVQKLYGDDDLAAQSLIFFLAGFDTVATTMSFMAYELVANPDVQYKLHREIAGMNYHLNGRQINYEQIQHLRYLDQTISETLRKWPVAGVAERTCTKDYDLKFDGKTLHIEKGLSIQIPIHCFHHDPKYFPEPEKFNPERFSPKNRKKIDPDTYMPFGIGPRCCIGSRFAIMQMKTIFYFLVLNFRFEKSEKTLVPFEYEDAPFAILPRNGFLIALKPRP